MLKAKLRSNEAGAVEATDLVLRAMVPSNAHLVRDADGDVFFDEDNWVRIEAENEGFLLFAAVRQGYVAELERVPTEQPKGGALNESLEGIPDPVDFATFLKQVSPYDLGSSDPAIRQQAEEKFGGPRNLDDTTYMCPDDKHEWSGRVTRKPGEETSCRHCPARGVWDDDGAMIRPEPDEVTVGSQWRHENGLGPYIVIAIANTSHVHVDHPTHVVYKSGDNWWSRPLSQWHRKFKKWE